MTGWGLVLGGGGPVGAAWYSGLAEGLANGGVDLRSAEVIIGTSAGAIAGAWLASARPQADFADAMRRNAADRGESNFADDLDLDVVVVADSPKLAVDAHRNSRL